MVLRLMSWATLAALVICLPLFLLRTSCLGSSVAPSPLGGRFGTLNDLSILRLVSTISSDESSAMSRRSSVLTRRAENGLSATDVRNRLIILLVLIVVVIVLPTVWVLRWTLHGLKASQTKWKEQVCGGEEMVWLPLSISQSVAPNEAQVVELAKEQTKDKEASESEEFRIRKVFAIP